MPPRENQRVNISVDSVHASGPAGHAHCVIHGTCNYKQTGLLQAYAAYHLCQAAPRKVGRSEEHTSELQSLMRISYAVFCLKKKTTNQRKRTKWSTATQY